MRRRPARAAWAIAALMGLGLAAGEAAAADAPRREARRVPSRAFAARCAGLGQAVDATQAHALLPSGELIDALEQDAPGRARLARRLADDTSARGALLLELLLHDPAPEVQAQALATALSRCGRDGAPMCLAWLQAGSQAADEAVQWRATLELLARAPQRALQLPDLLRLEVVAHAALQLGRAGEPKWVAVALRQLADDADPEVQEAAAAALMAAGR